MEMANFRPALLITLVFLGYLLWIEWQKDYGPRSPAAPGKPRAVRTAARMDAACVKPRVPCPAASTTRAQALPSSSPITSQMSPQRPWPSNNLLAISNYGISAISGDNCMCNR